MASRILGSHTAGGPFGKPLVEHTHAELDFILEMGAKDEPDRFTFLRGGIDARRQVPEAAAAWASALSGRALAERMQAGGLTDAQRRLNEYKARATGGMRPGVTRGGKAVPDA